MQTMRDRIAALALRLAYRVTLWAYMTHQLDRPREFEDVNDLRDIARRADRRSKTTF